jgi:hypothetical protein
MTVTNASMTSIPGSSSDAPRRRRGVALILLGLVSVQIGWLLAVPVFYGIDEIDHVYRASSVARGHWQASNIEPEDGRGALIPVPEDIVAAARAGCEELTYVGPDNCSPTSEPDAHGQVLIASAAATYNPAWYFVVGTAARPFDGAEAVLAMRLCSLLLCDLAIGAALWLLGSRTPSRWANLGVVLACTPVLLYSSINAAPNGLGYCAGLLLWASLLTLPREPSAALKGPLTGVAVSAPVLMATHSTGLLWVAMTLVCAAPVVLPRLMHAWTRSKGAIIAVGLALAAAAVVNAAWVLSSGTNDLRADGSYDYGPVPVKTLVQGLILWPLQSIATLQTRNTAAPIAVYAVGAAMLAVFVLVGWRASRRAEKISMAAIAVMSLVIPLAATIAAYPRVAAAWQGRYGLALLLGIVVIAGTALARGVGPRAPTCWFAAVGFGFLHWATLASMFKVDLGGAAHSWTPCLLILGGLVTAAAFGAAFTRPASLRE